MTIEMPQPGEVYRHFKGGYKLYGIMFLATGTEISAEDSSLYRTRLKAKDCENPSRELPVLESLDNPQKPLLNGAELDVKYVVYRSLYDNEFPKGTFWFRSLEAFVGFKVLEDGAQVKRFVRVPGSR